MRYNSKVPDLTPGKFLKTSSITHLLFSVAMVILIIVAYIIFGGNGINISNTNDVFFFIVPIAAVAGLYMSNIVYKKKIRDLSEKESLKEKLTEFQTAAFIRYALLEGPVLLGIVAYISVGNLLYVLISAFIAIYFFSLRPKKEKIEAQLNLTSEQRVLFNKPNQILL